MIVLKSNVFIFVFFLFLERSTAVYRICNEKVDPIYAKKVHLVVYKSPGTFRDATNLVSYDFTLDNPKGLLESLDLAKPTVMYIHGFLESANARTTQSVVRAYLRRGDVNVIAVDWSAIVSNINYAVVVESVVPVGRMIAGILNGFREKFDFRNLHVIGHSLGAQVASSIGRYLDGPLGRITGLDPAFPLFYPSNCHLQPTDAKVVVALHTDAGVYGTPFNTGSVDFYANMGTRPQPGCPVIGAEPCSHQRSVYFHAESVTNPKAFLATRCSSVTRVPNSLESNEKVYYGDLMPENTSGTFCFATNMESPFSRGDTG